MTMPRQERNKRLQEILGRLDEMAKQDGALILSRSSPSRPVTISFEQLFDYGERFGERQKLHDDLRNLISELIED
jgi:hypothetical protein